MESVEITVEVQTLKMDNMMSVSGRESYVKFYTTTRKFPKVSAVFEDELIIPLEYKDCKVLKFGDPGDGVGRNALARSVALLSIGRLSP